MPLYKLIYKNKIILKLTQNYGEKSEKLVIWSFIQLENRLMNRPFCPLHIQQPTSIDIIMFGTQIVWEYWNVVDLTTTVFKFMKYCNSAKEE